jgi:hypothetical protein
MKYTTDYKWKPLRYQMDGDCGFTHKGIKYLLSDFTKCGNSWISHRTNEDSPFPIHAIYYGSAFHAIGIEIDESNEMYRVCTVTT